ncbi:unnamed protein product [Cuscuta campestris]|uniref:Thioredoxin-like protein AAED1, chloroplastic n=1 Tax=Cuscuta campestris TaxID=132261 RepID=A0A484KHF0_9ASTE|nr:unnamed protein product [Cuscuta campestris]
MAAPLFTTARNYRSIFVFAGSTYRNSLHQNLSFSVKFKPKPFNFSSHPSRLIIISAKSTSTPTGTESHVASEEAINVLENVEVCDLGGKAVPISDLWKDRRAVVAFARHFGCVLCRKRADYLAAFKDKMDDSGVALVLIGPGSADQAKTFAAQTKFKGEVYADPSHASYEAFGFVSGISTTFTPKAGLKTLQAYMEPMSVLTP